MTRAMGISGNQTAVDVIRASAGDALVVVEPADRERYLALLASIRRPRDVALDVVGTGQRSWTVAICTTDFLGALSLIVGLLTAHCLNIRSADVLTLTVPERREAEQPRRRGSARSGPRATSLSGRLILDVFEVRALADPDAALWPRFRAELAALVANQNGQEARDEIIGRVSEAFRALGTPAAKLLPMAIDVANPPSSPHTRLSVRSADTPGFLFAFASALADLTLNVERASVRTVGGEARDTFWVTDVVGRPIRDERRIHELRVATSLIKHFTYLLPRSPNPGQALRQFNALVSQMLSRPEWTTELANLESPAVLETLAELMGVSRFLWEDFLRLQHESLFPLLLDVPSLAGARPKETLREELRQRLRAVDAPTAKVRELNAFKDRELFRIDLRHIVGRSEFVEFSRELSGLAEVAVEAAGELAQTELIPRFGWPRLADGRICPWCIGALGKFGGEELGFGSDLELLFVYGSEGVTDGPEVISSSEYFGRLVQTFLRTLTARQEGVFEIDLRLRPFGRAGALASSFAGFTRYYASDGGAAQFERLALVRLRPIAGDRELGTRLQHARDAYVYSGAPLDLANVRHLRQRQATELVPRGRVNAKYSPGGLVDLEYFVQAWQITVGAADASMRVTNTREAIRRLAERGYLRGDLADELRETYTFLRRLIDALRVVRGHAKDLTIPAEDSRDFAYLAQRTRLPTAGALREALATRMAFARALWTEAPPPIT